MLAASTILLTLIAYPFYLKYLGAEQYGLWTTLSVIISFSQLGNLGINTALIKYIAEEVGKENYKEITKYTTTSFYILAIPSSLVLLIVFLFSKQIVAFLELKPLYISKAEHLIPLIGLLSIFILFVDLIKGILMGIGRIDISNYIFLIGKIIQIALSIILVIDGWEIWGLYFGAVSAYGFIFIIYLYILCINYKMRIFRINSFTKKCFNNLIIFGGTIFSARLVSMLVEPFNKVIISKYIGLSEVTYYELALRGAISLRSLYEMGLKAIMPKISELQYKAQDIKNSISNIHKQSIKFILFFALPVFCGLFFSAKSALSIWLGNDYNPQILMGLKWFLCGYIINLFSVPSYYIFMGLNNVKLCFYAASLKSFIHSGIILFFIAMGFSITFNLIIIVNTFTIVLSALFIVIMYYIKMRQYIVQKL